MCGGGGIIGAVSDAVSGVGNAISNTVSGVSNAAANIGQGVSDVVHDVGTTIADNPILSAATGVALNAAGVPAPIAAGLVQANRGATPEQVLGSAALAGAVDNAFSSPATTSPVASPTVTGTDLPPLGAVSSPVSMPDITGTPLPPADLTAAAPATLGSLANTTGAAMPTDIFANPDYSQYTGPSDAAQVMAGYTTPISDAQQVMNDYSTPVSDASQAFGGYTMPNVGTQNTQASSLLNTLTGTPLGQATTIGALGSLLQGYLGSNAANTAAQIQANATQNAINQMTGVYNQTSAQNAPYRGLGYQAANAISGLLPGQGQQYDAMGNPTGTATGSGYLTQQFTPEAFATGIDPGYAFRLQQGQMANQRAGNVGGGALSGNVLKGLQDYTQGAASQEYQNAFNRFQTQRQNIYSNLANIAGIGQTSQGQQNQLASNLAQTTAQMNVGNAAAQAAGQIGQANAYGNAIGSIGNAVTLAGLLGQKGNVAATPSNPVTTASNTIGSLGNLANTVGNLSNIFG